LERGAIRRSTIIATNEIAIAPRLGVPRRTQDQTIQSDLADHPQRRRDMAMRQRPLDLQFLRARADQRAALEDRLQRRNHLTRQLAQIGKRPLLRPAVLVPITLPQQHRRWGGAIRHSLDEHARIESYSG
jgi:hypothetical protein